VFGTRFGTRSPVQLASQIERAGRGWCVAPSDCCTRHGSNYDERVHERHEVAAICLEGEGLIPESRSDLGRFAVGAGRPGRGGHRQSVAQVVEAKPSATGVASGPLIKRRRVPCMSGSHGLRVATRREWMR
jgi:hypothetical protein